MSLQHPQLGAIVCGSKIQVSILNTSHSVFPCSSSMSQLSRQLLHVFVQKQKADS